MCKWVRWFKIVLRLFEFPLLIVLVMLSLVRFPCKINFYKNNVNKKIADCFSFHCNLLISTIILQLQISQRLLLTNIYRKQSESKHCWPKVQIKVFVLQLIDFLTNGLLFHTKYGNDLHADENWFPFLFDFLLHGFCIISEEIQQVQHAGHLVCETVTRCLVLVLFYQISNS